MKQFYSNKKIFYGLTDKLELFQLSLKTISNKFLKITNLKRADVIYCVFFFKAPRKDAITTLLEHCSRKELKLAKIDRLFAKILLHANANPIF